MQLKTSSVWFRFIKITYPWTALVLRAWQFLCASGLKKTKAEVRLMITLAKTDIASVLSFVNDLLY